jgi:hypothetical protein
VAPNVQFTRIVFMFVKSMQYEWHHEAIQVLRSLPRINNALANRLPPTYGLKDLDSVWPIANQPVAGGMSAFPT